MQESIWGNQKKKSKNTYYCELFPKYKNDIKNTWKTINEIISNTKNKRKDLPEKLVINFTAVLEKQEIVENLNKYFINIGPNLASEIPNKQGFEKYLANCNTVTNDVPLTDEEVRNAFYSLKTNKSPGYDDISFNAIDKVFEFIVEPLRYTFSNSLVQGIFPEDMKVARITPICKGGDEENVVNYRPIYVLPCFSKILEIIMYKGVARTSKKNLKISRKFLTLMTSQLMTSCGETNIAKKNKTWTP